MSGLCVCEIFRNEQERGKKMISINGHTIGEKCYPNNERILEIPIMVTAFRTEEFIIEMKYTTDIDISVLSMAKRYLDDQFNNPEVTLIMKYVPYSRMDRNIKGYMFSLKYFCKMINDLNFYKVMVLDVHSNVTTALLDRCVEIDVDQYIDKVFDEAKVDYVFYPDAGAMKRYYESLKTRRKSFYGNKKRDLHTGKIINYELVECPDIQGKDILIIDDLCAYGGTFQLASEKLKEKGANNIYLYVSHCENSIYNGKLINSGLVSKIFTTDSILSDWSSNLICNVEK